MIERTALFLMANLGSELVRFFSFRGEHKNDLAQESADRAFKIIAQIAEKDSAGARGEALIFKAVIEDALSAAPCYKIYEEEINSYFAPLAERVLLRQ